LGFLVVVVHLALNTFSECHAAKVVFQKNRTLGLIMLARSMHRFSRDAEFYSAKNGVDSERLGFGALNLFSAELLNAATYEATGCRHQKALIRLHNVVPYFILLSISLLLGAIWEMPDNIFGASGSYRECS
jgi:hypothetical protein